MAQKISDTDMAIWIATENIARFQLKLSTETDICERKFLEGLIALERAKLAEKSLD